jgi:Reverse transcriptase (RNA-dependent DNA polymerase)
VSSKQSSIHKWIELPLTLPNGSPIVIKCAVVTNLPCVALFGLPFLTQIHAVHDITNAILNTPQGPIPLKSSPSTSSSPTSSTAIVPNRDFSVVDIDFTNSSLTPEEQQQVQDLLLEYDDLWRGGPVGKAVAVEHRIRLLTDRPIVSRPRPITEEQKKIIHDEVQRMLNEKIIRPSDSPYASEVVLVHKKTGDWRFCIDFRPLNKATVKDKHPLPRISDLVHAVKGSRYFAALDLRAGYWQIPMEKTSMKYTAFRCFLGLYEFICMPFSLTNAPATF